MDPLSNDDILIAHLDWHNEISEDELWLLAALDTAKALGFHIRPVNRPKPEGEK
jgi:hypothetical protein